MTKINNKCGKYQGERRCSCTKEASGNQLGAAGKNNKRHANSIQSIQPAFFSKDAIGKTYRQITKNYRQSLPHSGKDMFFPFTHFFLYFFYTELWLAALPDRAAQICQTVQTVLLFTVLASHSHLLFKLFSYGCRHHYQNFLAKK